MLTFAQSSFKGTQPASIDICVCMHILSSAFNSAAFLIA